MKLLQLCEPQERLVGTSSSLFFCLILPILSLPSSRLFNTLSSINDLTTFGCIINLPLLYQYYMSPNMDVTLQLKITSESHMLDFVVHL